MVYKKYIKRGNKTYGPYIYHSKKINGRVTSEYLGKGEEKKKRTFPIFVAIIIALLLLSLIIIPAYNKNQIDFSKLFANIKNPFTGFSISDNLENESVEQPTEQIVLENNTTISQITNNETIELTNETLIVGNDTISEQNETTNETTLIEEANQTETAPVTNVSIPTTSEPNITTEKANITVPLTPENNITVQTNLTILTEENATIQTIQYPAVLNQPVRWRKQISPESAGNLTIKLPKEAENIIVNKIENQNREMISPISITGRAISRDNLTTETSGVGSGGVISSNPQGFFARLFAFLGLTGKAIDETSAEKEVGLEIDNIEAEYEVEYETPAPYAIEQDTETGKQVEIIGLETLHYENVLSFTSLNESLNIKSPSMVKIKWIEQNTYIIPLSVQDTNNNGIYDYVEWTTPSLSNQTFEIIIEISKAEHLDSNRTFISDIYEQVKLLDDVWSEAINNNEYVRVTFEQNLTSSNDITLYPRVVSGNPSIEVYEVNSNSKIAEFENLTSNDYNKILLTNLQSESQDVFDLRVIGGSLELDYIVDPMVGASTGEMDIGVAALDNRTIVIVYTNSSNVVAFQIWNTEGTLLLGPITVNATNVPVTSTRVAVSAVNSTSFIIGWSNTSSYLIAGYDRATGATYFPRNAIVTGNNTNTIKPDLDLTIAGGYLFYYFINLSISPAPATSGNATAISRINTTTGATIGTTGSIITGMVESVGARLNNSISCDAINSTAVVCAEYASGTADDITWHIISTAGTEIVGDPDVDSDVGNASGVAVTTLDGNRIAGVYFDSRENDVTFWINSSAPGPGNVTDIDTNVGQTTNGTKVGIATVRNQSTNQDDFIVAWTNSTDLVARGYNKTGGQSVARFAVDTNPSNATFYILGAQANGQSLCNGTWIIAYKNTSNVVQFKGYWLNGSVWNGTCFYPVTDLNAPNITNITWLTVGGSTSRNLTYGTTISYFNATVIDTNPVTVTLTLTDPDLINVINNQPMSNTTPSSWNYSIPVTLEKAGNWTVNITATDGVNTRSNTTNITINIVKRTTREGWYGYSYGNISSASEINDLINYNFELLELQNNYSTLNASWLNVKAAINNSYNINVRTGLNVVFNYNYSILDQEKNATYNISRMFPELLGDPYSITMEYLSIELVNISGYSGSQLINTSNNLAEAMLMYTNNKFPVFVKNYNLSFYSAYVRHTPMLYLTGENESVLMDKEIRTIKTNLSLNRIYYGLNATTKLRAMNTHTVYSTLRSAVNSTSLSEPTTVSLNNMDVLVFNNLSAKQNYSLALSEIPITGKDVWTHADNHVIEVDTDGTFNVSVESYGISVVYFEDLQKMVMSDLTTSTAYKQTVPFTGNANYTKGETRTGNWNLDNQSDILIDLYDPHYYEKANFITYYGWINASKINDRELCDNSIIIIADKNDGEVDGLVGNCTFLNTSTEIYGYVSVFDYSNTDAWFLNKTADVGNWTILNESMNLFIDGIDVGVGGTNFSSRMKDLVDYVQIQKGKKAILNTYTAYQNFSTWGTGGVMRESCVNRWNGLSSSVPSNYSREDWSLELNKSAWLHSHNVRVICQAFNNRTTDGSDIIENYTELQNIYFGARVLGYEYFYLSQPDFQYPFTEYIYDVGDDLSNAPLTNDNETYYRLYSEGIIYYNISSGYGWIDDGRAIQNSQVCFNLYDNNASNNVTLNFNVNRQGTTDTGDYEINDKNLSAAFTWQYVCANVTNPPVNGRYLIEAWVMPRSTLSTQGLYLNWSNFTNYSTYSYYDSAVTDSWSPYASGINWGVNIRLTDTKTASIDTSDKITQTDTFSSTNAIVNISSTYPFNISIFSDVISVNSSFANITYTGVHLNISENDDCDTANPTFFNISISGEIHGACRKLIGDNYSVRIRAPSLSERIYTISGPVTMCSPTLDIDWLIEDEQTCDSVEVTTGTGSTFITSTGFLYLINGANLTTTGLNVSGTGNKVFINRGGSIRI